MKILLIGNYPYLRSQSMDRFANILYKGLTINGHDVRLLKPIPILGRLAPRPTGVGKWLGYLDRFVLFPFMLIYISSWADIIHICDQANAVYFPIIHKPHIVTCHDMLAIHSAFGKFNENQISLTGTLYQKWILSSLKRVWHIACDSNKTYSDLVALAGRSNDNASVVPLGLNYAFRPMHRSESKKHLYQLGINDRFPFFLNVGGNLWYKNKEGLLRIFKHILTFSEPARPMLVLVGQKLDKKLKTLSINIGIYDHIYEVTDVSNEQLCSLYSSAKGLIFPSLAEGFGWPIIEAQACGCPVFTSNRPPMVEIGGKGAVYFNPLDEIGAAKIITKALLDEHKLKKEGYRNVSYFSTDIMLSNYRDCYKKALQKEL